MRERRKHRRGKAQNYLTVFDRITGRRIGELANLSQTGAMFVTAAPVKTSTRLQCRVPLHKPILNREEILFDAECRWCRRNAGLDRWESGYTLTLSGVDEEMVDYLTLSFVVGAWEIPGDPEVQTVVEENRRNAKRFEAPEPFPVFEQKSPKVIGHVTNISSTGVGLATLDPVEKGKVLNCRARLPKRIFGRDYLVFDAACVWCRNDEKTGLYESGYQLQNVSEHDTVIILHLMIHYLEEQPTTQRVRVIN